MNHDAIECPQTSTYGTKPLTYSITDVKYSIHMTIWKWSVTEEIQIKYKMTYDRKDTVPKDYKS